MSTATDALGDRIVALSAHINAARSRLTALIAEFDTGRGWAREGCASCAHWLSWKCGLSPAAAREQVRVARALAALPRVRAAFETGALSYSKVRALSRVATPESEPYYLMIAEHGTAAHMETVVRGVRRVHRSRELREENARAAGRGVRWRYDEHGMLHVGVCLAPEQGARFLAALSQMTDTVARERGETLSADEAEAPAPAPSSFSALRADALVRLVEGDSPQTELVVHVSAETLIDDASDGCCEVEGGPGLHPRTARRLACDAGVVRLIEDADGQPLDVGRKTRSIPPALRRALTARDGGCRFPGCGTAHRVEGHHLRHWAHGGETSLSNLVSLCRHHHRAVHEGGFTVSRCGRGAFRFETPGGETLKQTVPRVRVEGCPEQALIAANQALGLGIGSRTGVSRWDGLPMDAARAVEGALSASGELAW